MNRKYRREYAKQVARGEISIGIPQTKLVAKELVDYNGKKYDNVADYIDVMEKDCAKRMSGIATEMLYDAEIYACAANILIMLIAMEMTIGELKTVQKSYQKIIDKYNEAAEYLETVGLKAAYEGFKKDYNIELEFNDCELGWLWDEGEKILQRFKLRVGR